MLLLLQFGRHPPETEWLLVTLDVWQPSLGLEYSVTQQKGVLRWFPPWQLLQQLRLRKKSLERRLEPLDVCQQSLCLVYLMTQREGALR